MISRPATMAANGQAAACKGQSLENTPRTLVLRSSARKAVHHADLGQLILEQPQHLLVPLLRRLHLRSDRRRVVETKLAIAGALRPCADVVLRAEQRNRLGARRVVLGDRAHAVRAKTRVSAVCKSAPELGGIARSHDKEENFSRGTDAETRTGADHGRTDVHARARFGWHPALVHTEQLLDEFDEFVAFESRERHSLRTTDHLQCEIDESDGFEERNGEYCATHASHVEIRPEKASPTLLVLVRLFTGRGISHMHLPVVMV